MDKLTLSNIVDFRRKSETSKVTFVNKLKKPKETTEVGGGDYWIISTSSASNYFRNEDLNEIDEKIEEVTEKKAVAPAKISKNMFQKNIDILSNFDEIEMDKVKPNFKLSYISKPKSKSIIKVRALPIQVRPQHVFTFNESNIEKIGSIWFISKLGGYNKNEQVLFTDALYQYLKVNYSKDFDISTNFVIAFDLSSMSHVSYSQIERGDYNSQLNETLDEINKLM